MRILLAVAEDRAICESLRAAIPKSDLVLFEQSLDGALQRLITLQPDAILLDDAAHLGRKALNGLVDSSPQIPVIVLSSVGDRDTLASYALAGARDCLVKPFECGELLKLIDECVERRVESRVPVSAVPVDAAPGAPVQQHQIALRWMSRSAAHLEDPARLMQSLVEALVDIFDAVRAAVLLHSNDSARIVASHGIAPNVSAPVQLSFSRGLLRWLEENACILDRRMNPQAADAVREMQVLGARLAVPLISGGRTRGAILLGERSSGGDYTHEERELLSVMARSVALSLEKAKHYRDIARQQSRLDAVLANMTAGVVTVRPDKTVSMMNESAEGILRLRAIDVLGRSVQKLGSGFADVVLRCLSEGRPLLRQPVRDVAINATLGLSVTPLGAEGAVVIFSIIPAEAKEEEDLGYSPIWEYLASRVAQEIKNPMVAINTFAQLLPKKYDAEDFRKDFSEVVQREVGRINGVVELLYEFSRHPRLVFHERDLNQAIEDTLTEFQEELAKRSIKVETLFSTEDMRVEVDPTLFQRAVKSLVQNSVEAMPEGGTLRVSTARHNGCCDVIIADSGPGVSDKNAGLIFMPFFSTKEQGMGLGLTLASRIVEQHDGRIELLQDKGGGGAFAIHLPPATGKRSGDTAGGVA